MAETLAPVPGFAPGNGRRPCAASSGLQAAFEALQAGGHRPVWQPSGGIRAHVPGRVDRHPSLSVWESNGRVHFKDHAGILMEEQIRAALGFPAAEASPGPSGGGGRREVAAYSYEDESGQALFEVVRFEPKAFRQRRWVGGQAVWGLGDVRRVLFRLPRVIAAVQRGQPVYVCEGEKDALALEVAGAAATCNPGGAGKWRPDYSEFLRGADVIIVADRDEPGARHADAVQASLSGVAASVRVVQAREGKDAADHLAAGCGLEDFEPARFSLSCFSYIEKNEKQEKQERRQFRMTPLCELLQEPPEDLSWVVDAMLPASGLSMLAAKPKVGKSTLARNLALCVARGEDFLGRGVAAGAVLYFALEEKRGEVAAHFQRMGGSDENILVHVGSAPEDALREFADLLRAHRPALAIVDPVLKMVRLRDASDYAEVSAKLEPLLDLARETGAHILVTHHLGKNDRGDGDAVLGSTALFGAVDTLIELRKRDQGRVAKSLQRYGTDLAETVASLDEDTGIVSAAGDLRELQIHAAMDKVRDALAGGQLTQKEARDLVEGSTALTTVALNRLLESGELSRTGTGRKGDPFLYALAQSPDISTLSGDPDGWSVLE